MLHSGGKYCVAMSHGEIQIQKYSTSACFLSRKMVRTAWTNIHEYSQGQPFSIRECNEQVYVGTLCHSPHQMLMLTLIICVIVYSTNQRRMVQD